MLVEWITIITVLLILGILLDGWRRMRNHQRGKIKMSRSMPEGAQKEDLEVYGSELPSGGARVVGVRDDSETEQLNQEVKAGLDDRKVGTAGSARIPKQVALNLEESVPMLMDVDDTVEEVELPAADDVIDEPINDGELDMPGQGSNKVEPSFSSADLGEPLEERASAQQSAAVDSDAGAEPEDVIVINVMARKGTRFDGQVLMDVLLQCDMRFGDMAIFHRHEQPDGEGPVLFSMVNMIKPGTFSLADTSSFETPGVSLFMTLPLSSDPIAAFNAMAVTAHELQKALGAELKDEHRSVMTLQTLEHSRERICEYQRKQRLASCSAG